MIVLLWLSAYIQTTRKNKLKKKKNFIRVRRLLWMKYCWLNDSGTWNKIKIYRVQEKKGKRNGETNVIVWFSTRIDMTYSICKKIIITASAFEKADQFGERATEMIFV